MVDGSSGAVTGLAYYNIQQQLTAVSAEKEQLVLEMKNKRYEDTGLGTARELSLPFPQGTLQEDQA